MSKVKIGEKVLVNVGGDDFKEYIITNLSVRSKVYARRIGGSYQERIYYHHLKQRWSIFQ